jgi:hydroxymethylbilane synthase
MARPDKPFRVGTRRSRLAMTQTSQMVRVLERAAPDARFVTVEIVTKGDRVQDVALSKVGGKGLFISEIEDALLRGEIDFAVHSMKDVPAVLAPGLTIAAVARREDPRDLLIARAAADLDSLPKSARVGTSSLRRAAQLLRLRPDLRIEPLRGNIDTRLRRLGELDAIVLAAAGLIRMGWWRDGRIKPAEAFAAILSPEQVLPAAGQGALALECRVGDAVTRELLAHLHDPETAVCVSAERAFLARVGGSCQVPVAALARLETAGVLVVDGLIASPDGQFAVRSSECGDANPEPGDRLAERLLAQGGRAILQRLEEEGAAL